MKNFQKMHVVRHRGGGWYCTNTSIIELFKYALGQVDQIKAFLRRYY